MAEAGSGDLRKRDGPANAVSASVSAVGGLRSSRYRTPPNREFETCQWQNGTFRCEFGHRWFHAGPGSGSQGAVRSGIRTNREMKCVQCEFGRHYSVRPGSSDSQGVAGAEYGPMVAWDAPM